MAYDESALIRRLPHGLTDLFLEQAAAKTAVEGVLQETFRRWGYSRIIPPTFEYYDTLAAGASVQLKQEMYRFFDREGNILALRPDMTVPTARVVSGKLYDRTPPLRCYYVGNVFRHIEPQAGWRREFTQAGIELIGAGTPEADAEVVAVAVAALKAMKVADFQVNLGQVSYLQAILSEAGLGNGELRRLEQAIDRRNDIELQRVLAELGITGDAARAIRAVPHLCGDEGVLCEAERLATNPPARQAIEHLARVYELLCLEGVAEHIILDLGEMRGMAYYTGITFHGYAAGLGFPICGGGRYDNLLANFGADLPAVGFALGVERILLVTHPEIDLAPHLVMRSCSHPACRALAAQTRARGSCVEVDVLGRQDEALVAYARAKGAHYVVCCGEGPTYTLTDLRSSEPGCRRVLNRHELEQELALWSSGMQYIPS
jgi:ATP phosphoribosyltransferase regulatory subunit